VKASAGDMVIVEKLERAEYRFGELCTINQGLRTGDNQKYLSDTQKGKLWKPVVGGKHVARYGPFQRGTYVCYEPKMLDAPRRREIFEAHEKLVVQEIRNITLPRRLIASYDDEQFFCLQSTNVINLRPSAAKGWNMKFLLGILNSGAANYFFRQRFASNNHIASNQIAKIPVPNVSLEKQTNIARLVDLILSLHRRLAVSKAPGDRTVLQRQIEATDREIDTAVYELYGLTRSEIKVVEERG
jgi:hypothetical protein